jgi:hypothetical protein
MEGPDRNLTSVLAKLVLLDGIPTREGQYVSRRSKEWYIIINTHRGTGGADGMGK